MRSKVLVMLVLAAVVAAGCSATQLKSQKDDSWRFGPTSLPDRYDPNPTGYGHPFRGPAFVLHPVGVALDWILIKPFYMLAGLAPEWFGLTSDDAQHFQQHHPELVNSPNAPKRFE
jgi:hypothetical protein